MDAGLSDRAGARVVAALAAAWAAAMTAVCLLRLRNLAYGDFDLAVHAQSLFNLLRGSIDSSILGIPFPGNHLVAILAPLAPLGALMPPPALLLAAQSVVLAAGAWPLYRLAAREAGTRWGLGFAALYLAHPPLWLMALYEFHPVALASSLLLFALDAYRARRFGPCAAWLGATLLCQENLGLVVAGFGAMALADGRRGRWAWAPLAAGAAWFLCAVAWWMPRWNPGTVGFASLYGHLGDSLPEVAANVLRHPIAALRVATEPRKLQFLALLLGPLAGASLLGPLLLVPALPALAQRLLSARPTESTILYHYQAEFIPFAFAAAAAGTGWLLRRGPRARRWAPALGAAMAASTALAWTLGGGLAEAVRRVAPAFAPGPVAEAGRAIVRAVPDGAPVLATFAFLPSLSQRERLYSLHQVYGGRYTLSTRPYRLPGPVDFVALDSMDPLAFGPFYETDGGPRLRAVLADGEWRVAEQAGSLLLLRRGDAGEPLAALFDAGAPPPAASLPVEVRVHGPDPGFRLLAAERLADPAPGRLALRLTWARAQGPASDALARVEVRDAADRIVADAWVAPGHRLWPPQDWPAGGRVADRHVFFAGRAVGAHEALRASVAVAPLGR